MISNEDPSGHCGVGIPSTEQGLEPDAVDPDLAFLKWQFYTIVAVGHRDNAKLLYGETQ